MKTFISFHFISYISFTVSAANLIVDTLDFITILHYYCTTVLACVLTSSNKDICMYVSSGDIRINVKKTVVYLQLITAK